MNFRKYSIIGIMVFLLVIPVNAAKEGKKAASAPEKKIDKQKQTPLSDAEVDSQLDKIDPNSPKPLYPLHGKPGEKPLPALTKITKYWLPRYNPKVTRRVFLILGYPYYYDGKAYPRNDLPELLPIEQVETRSVNIETGQSTGKNEKNAPDKSLTADKQDSPARNPGGKSDVTAKGSAAATKGSTVTPNEAVDWNARRVALERCCDVIHRWRSLNESAATAKEIARTIELTRADTNIYRLQPQLAVLVRRILGKIGRTNHKFDLTSRMAWESLLRGKIDKLVISRMEKQLVDLQNMLAHLAEYNDEIGIILGIGKFERQRADSETLDYSHLDLPPGKLEFPKDKFKTSSVKQINVQ